MVAFDFRAGCHTGGIGSDRRWPRCSAAEARGLKGRRCVGASGSSFRPDSGKRGAASHLRDAAPTRDRDHVIRDLPSHSRREVVVDFVEESERTIDVFSRSKKLRFYVIANTFALHRLHAPTTAFRPARGARAELTPARWRSGSRATLARAHQPRSPRQGRTSGRNSA